MEKRLACLVLFIIVFSLPMHVYAIDEVKLAPAFSPQDQRYVYPYAVLKRALEATVESDGPFRIVHMSTMMKRNRALTEMVYSGDINVHIAATRDEWESQTIPIRIPVLKGLLGYRLFLIDRKNEQKFKLVDNIEVLKKFKAGSGEQWTTTAVLKSSGFNVVPGKCYEGLFGMLADNRFDYFPRGINEIYLEMDVRKNKYPNLFIEPTLALYFPTPSYFFVSPHLPKLADRIRRGTEHLIKTGELDEMFVEAYGEAIARSGLKDRKLFRITNPLLPEGVPIDREELWFTP